MILSKTDELWKYSPKICKVTDNELINIGKKQDFYSN